MKNPHEQLSWLLKRHLHNQSNLNDITQSLGICKQQLMKYVDMTGSPRMNTAEKLFEYFGYEIKIEERC
jgi:DNA-binding phage protein